MVLPYYKNAKITAMISKVLIANRSEVALRIQATCHARGIQTVAVYSKEDAQSAFVSRATQAFQLEKHGAQAYFDADTLIAIACRSGADAVHPGYGFLAENAQFAQKVINAGLVWIGPSPASMALMGDKIAARTLMDRVGVPTIPGVVLDALTLTAEMAREHARGLGYPVMIKDPKSGGGKAMRRVLSDEAFCDAWQAVLAEARRLTGSTVMLIEKYISTAKHVEVQVAGDGTSWIHLFERDCSVQRRNQKIIEEAPCVSVSQSVLKDMHKVACIAAQAAQYTSIGTVEFIVTPDEQFYFLEMNTRLQVEHGVTELTTGIDLVGLQLDIAQNTPSALPDQESITRHGYAIQCRLYAENPATRFTPSTGTITSVSFPSMPWVRVEHDLARGREITAFFDPMIAKILAWGASREQCIGRLQEALRLTTVIGIITNKSLLYDLLGTVEFRDGLFYTSLLGDKEYLDSVANGLQSSKESGALLAGLAVALMTHAQTKTIRPSHIVQHAVPSRRWREQR